MKIKKYKISRLFIFASVLMALSACEKAENYYQKLQDQPEIQPSYGKVYGVGDTISITGRLNPDNKLVVNIGGVSAVIIETAMVPAPGSNTVNIDRIKVIVTKEMGIGLNRLVEITSSGNTIECPAIEIIESSNSGFLPKALKLAKHADQTITSIPLYCLNGKGSIYIWKTDKSINKIAKDGTVVKVLDATLQTDGFGTYSISTFYSGGVDPQEKYLYFSALTTDNSVDNSANDIFRVCRYDLQNKTLETLNRSLLPKTANQRTEQFFTPFEGTFSTVKIRACTGFYPDSKGNVYIHISPFAMAKLGSDKVLKYLFKFSNQTLPAIWNTASNSALPVAAVQRLIPGVEVNVVPNSVSADEALMYGYPRSGYQDFIQYDLTNQVETYRFSGANRYFEPVYRTDRPYISGSFGILTGEYELNNPPGLFGYMPLPGGKLLNLYYQGLERPNNLYAAQYPAFGTLNYVDKTGSRYAPGKLLRNGYVMNRTDKMLNYDEEGMVYMTANLNTIIVKTQFQ